MKSTVFDEYLPYLSLQGGVSKYYKLKMVFN